MKLRAARVARQPTAAPEPRARDAAKLRETLLAQAQQVFGNRAFSEVSPASPPAPEPDVSGTGEAADHEVAPAARGSQGAWLSESIKPIFLLELQGAVERGVAESLAGTGFTPANCPWLVHWFSYYRAQPAAHVERAVRRFEPESADVQDRATLVALLTARIQRSVAVWARSGEISGVPDGVPLDVPGTARADLDPRLVRTRLGAGQPLPAPVRSRMESAFRLRFPEVRLHTDSQAGELAQRAGARAFTLGSDIVFAPGEYRPGSPEGDALLAHEMAHVEQQRAATGFGSPAVAAEQDATRSAASVLGRLWGGLKTSVRAPRLRTGLVLQRCGASNRAAQHAPAGMIEATGTPLDGEAWRTAVAAANAETDATQKELAQARVVASALSPLSIRVHLAGQSHPDEEHPDDYAPAGPAADVINFDPQHRQKRRHPSGGRVGQNPGHTFQHGPNSFSIINPQVIAPGSVGAWTPLVARQYAQHELYHSTHPANSSANEELAVWTNDFINYFHQYYLAGLPARSPNSSTPGRPQWEPLAQYYAEADAPAQLAARRRLLVQYRQPPASVGDPQRFRQEFRRYLERFRDSAGRNRDRNPQLANDLLAEMGPP